MKTLIALSCLLGLSCSSSVPASAPIPGTEEVGSATTSVRTLASIQVAEEVRAAFPAAFEPPPGHSVAPVIEAPTPEAEPRSPAFPGDQDAISWDTEPLALYGSLAAYCDAVQDRAAKRRESYETPVTVGDVGCVEVSPGVGFRPGGGFLGLRALRVRDGEGGYTVVLAQRAEGLLALPVSWDVDDPNDPGCGSIVRDTGLEEVTVQHGALVVVSLGERVTWVEPPEGQASDEDGARQMLLRSVMVVRPSGESFLGRGFAQAAFGGPELGFKLQPAARFTNWTRLPWRDRQPVLVDSQGRLLFKGT
jgi:hypothetical protein